MFKENKEEKIQTPSSYDPPPPPLRQEMIALMKLVESVRVDLLHTAMLLNYMRDYLKKMHK